MHEVTVNIQGLDKYVHGILDSNVVHEMISDTGQVLHHLMTSHDVLVEIADDEMAPVNYKCELKIGRTKVTVKARG